LERSLSALEKQPRSMSVDGKSLIFGMLLRTSEVLMRILHNVVDVQQVTITKILTQASQRGVLLLYTDEYDSYCHLEG
jgi:hypothetical protein